jgi:hypothetical protein
MSILVDGRRSLGPRATGAPVERSITPRAIGAPVERSRVPPPAVAWIVLSAALLLGSVACRKESPRTFAKPEQAVEALSSALGKNDPKAIETLFGPDSLSSIQSGDPVADQQDAERVAGLIAEGVTWEDVDDHTKVASFGKDPWPFPFPLVSENGRWRFDLASGEDELFNRRIGRNEISTLATLHAYVDAQREYWRARPMGEPPVFAQHFESDQGTRNGLYWPTPEGEEPSPLGELVAKAEMEGYHLREPAQPAALSESAAGGGGSGDANSAADEAEDGADDAARNGAAMGTEAEASRAYHGYHYRILKGQGEHASGGARSYLDDQGRMTSGFAAVAWPASYGNSGIMTLIVNQYGIVFQKDLGDDTEKLAGAMTVYDPDDTWAPTGD